MFYEGATDSEVVIVGWAPGAVSVGAVYTRIGRLVVWGLSSLIGAFAPVLEVVP